MHNMVFSPDFADETQRAPVGAVQRYVFKRIKASMKFRVKNKIPYGKHSYSALADLPT
jgi:hypothetical protein